MGKSTTTITIDTDLRDYFSNTNVNLSGLINNFLRSYKDKDTNTVNCLNIQIKKKELDQKMKDHASITAEVQALQREIATHEELTRTEEIKQLKREKERQDSLTHCAVCGKAIKDGIIIKGNKVYKCIDCVLTE